MYAIRSYYAINRFIKTFTLVCLVLIYPLGNCLSAEEDKSSLNMGYIESPQIDRLADNMHDQQACLVFFGDGQRILKCIIGTFGKIDGKQDGFKS